MKSDMKDIKDKSENNNDTGQKIFNSLRTKSDSNQFIRLYNALSRYVGEFNISKVVEEVFGKEKPYWIEDLINNVPGLQTGILSESDMNILNSIREKINNSVIVRIEMSFKPSDQFMDKVVNIIKNVYNSSISNVSGENSTNFMLDIHVKEGFEPGAVFYIKGNILDLRLRRIVTSYLLSHNVVERYL